MGEKWLFVVRTIDKIVVLPIGFFPSVCVGGGGAGGGHSLTGTTSDFFDQWTCPTLIIWTRSYVQTGMGLYKED